MVSKQFRGYLSVFILGAVLAVAGTYFSVRYFTDRQIADLKDRLKAQREAVRSAVEEADRQKRAAGEAERRFILDLAAREEVIAGLRAERRGALDRIRRLQTDVNRLQTALADAVGKVEEMMPDDLARTAETLVVQLYPQQAGSEVNYSVTDDVYRANEPAMRGFVFSLEETTNLRDQVGLFQGRIADLNLIVENQTREMILKDRSFKDMVKLKDRWKSSSRGWEDAFMAGRIESRVQAELISSYERKLFWERVVPDVMVGGGMVLGGDGKLGPGVAVMIGWDLGLIKKLLF